LKAKEKYSIKKSIESWCFRAGQLSKFNIKIRLSNSPILIKKIPKAFNGKST